MLRISLLAVVLLGLSLRVRCFDWSGTAEIDWKMQQILNNRAAVHPGSGLIAGDGFQSYQYNSTLALLSWFDSSYGYYNYSESVPSRHFFPIGFSHSSVARIPIKDGVPTSNFTNWPTGAVKVFNPHAAGNWYWPTSGVFINDKLHLLVQQEYAKSGGEWGNGTKMLLIENPLEPPADWVASYTVDIPSTGYLVDGNDGFVYKLSNDKGERTLQRWSKADMTNGRYENLECYVNASGKPVWSNSCGNSIALFDIGTFVVDSGNLYYHPWLQQWVAVISNSCRLVLWYAPEITGPWKKSSATWNIPSKYNSKAYCYQPNLHPAFVSSQSPNEIFATINTFNFVDKTDLDPDTTGFDKLWMTVPIAVRFELTKSNTLMNIRI